VLLLFHGNSAIAGTIQIETQTSVTVGNDTVQVTVAAANNGDEPARDVEAQLMVFGKRWSRKAKDVLQEGESVTVSFRKISAHKKAGTFPVITRITFQDINRHPFSAVSCSTVSIGEYANSVLDCQGQALSIANDGLLRFTVENSGSKSRKTTATLVLPQELSTPVPQKDFFIEPGEEEVLVFQISNFSALVGAVYPVFCFLEYESGKTHYTEIGNGSVEIVKSENWFRQTRSVWLGLAIAMGIILALCQVKRKSA